MRSQRNLRMARLATIFRELDMIWRKKKPKTYQKIQNLSAPAPGLVPTAENLAPYLSRVRRCQRLFR